MERRGREVRGEERRGEGGRLEEREAAGNMGL